MFKLHNTGPHHGDTDVAKEIRREQFVALCIFSLAVVCLVYIVVIQIVLPEGTNTSGYTVPGFIFMALFSLVAVHHYIIGVWSLKRELRRKTD